MSGIILSFLGIFGIAYMVESGLLGQMMSAGDFDALLYIGVSGTLILIMLGAKTGKLIYWLVVIYLIIKIIT